MSCYFCSRRHHTSICIDQKPKGESVMSSVDDDKVIYPVVVVKVGGIECRALLDSGASSCYASAKLLDLLGKRPTEIKPKKVVMLMASTTAKMEIYKSTVSSKSGDYSLEVNLTKVNRGELLSLENPRYEQLMKTYSHLKGVEMDDIDTKPLLPVHVILSAGVFARIKTDTRPRIGNQGEPVAERTKLGWVILSPGEEIDTTHMLLTQTSQVDYEELCKLDVLGLEDTPQHDQGEVYMEFREQLSRNEAGWYEAALPWKGNHPPLPSNKQGSLRRLENLKRKLERTGMEQAYSEIIEEQKAEGVVEAADQEPRGVEFYIPHKPVIREEAATTKVRVVYDASAKAHPNAVSLNDCLYPGPPLQNKLWNVLVRSRTHPVAVVGDLKKAFLQVRIKESDRDALRFHWKQGEHSEIETLRFTRALFGLAPSPFLLGGVITYHLETWEAREPHAVAELRKSLYVDDLISGGVTVEKARELKQQAIEIFEDATFTLHKWQSNEPKLEENPVPPVDKEGTFAKQQLVKPHAGGSGLLGLGWDKERDEIIISFPEREADPTKRGVLRKLASIYDPLGFVSPVTLVGKCLYRDVCCEKLAWDAELTGTLKLKKHGKVEAKAYIVLYACSLCRALYLDLVPSLETQEFILSLKKLIARKGRPEKIYSDNGTTFVGAARWLRNAMYDEKFNKFLAENEIIWQFNLSRAPWWGGQFERMVGLVKNAFYKTIGCGFLSWAELEEVLLDVEITLNDRPLSYVEDDVALPILTPNSMMFPQCNILPDLEPHHVDDVDLRRRAKHLSKCKNALWKRWSSEYVRSLRERHNLKHPGKPCTLAVGDVVILKSEDKNRGKWPLGIVQELYPGRDGVVRAVKLRSGKSFLERAVQHLYPLELSSDSVARAPSRVLNADATVFRPRRQAALRAEERIHQIAEAEENSG
ncbi:uncharacterized protein LOC144667518 [Oculina patagonica]